MSAANAAPFSIAVQNNVWPVYYNKCGEGGGGGGRSWSTGCAAAKQLPRSARQQHGGLNRAMLGALGAPPQPNWPRNHPPPPGPPTRSVRNAVRMTLYNVTLVVQEKEMSYVT